MARPKVWTAEAIAAVAPEICQRTANGESLRAICEGEGMPDRGTVLGWTIGEDPEHAAFASQYARARATRAEAWIEDLTEIVDVAQDSQSAAAQRLKFDARRWIISKLLPKKYGDKIDVTTGGEKLPGPVDLSRLSDETLDRAIMELRGKSGDSSGEA